MAGLVAEGASCIVLCHATNRQVSIAESVDSILTVLHMFREPLSSIELPAASSVDLGQATKDGQREAIVLNGVTFRVRSSDHSSGGVGLSWLGCLP
jgi:hypothetical protein